MVLCPMILCPMSCGLVSCIPCLGVLWPCVLRSYVLGSCVLWPYVLGSCPLSLRPVVLCPVSYGLWSCLLRSMVLFVQLSCVLWFCILGWYLGGRVNPCVLFAALTLCPALGQPLGVPGG